MIHDVVRGAANEACRYRELARQLAMRHGLPYPSELDALLTARLRELEIHDQA